LLLQDGEIMQAQKKQTVRIIEDKDRYAVLDDKGNPVCYISFADAERFGYTQNS
jgi:hypothetical protein